jgi:hypothetical protein
MTNLLHILYFLPVAGIILALKNPLALLINENEREPTSEAC